MASLSDAEVLEQYKTARDLIVAAIGVGESVVEFEIRGRRTRYTDPAAILDRVEKCIASYESKISAQTSGPARNFIRIAR